MIALIQRVTEASVKVNGQDIASINHGILALIGIEKDDKKQHQEKLVHKLLHYRIFSDDKDRMNLNVQQVNAELLLVPQFTLAANTNSGLRPSFSEACDPATAKEKFEAFSKHIKNLYPHTQMGKFGADMKVSLINDGPVTFWIQV